MRPLEPGCKALTVKPGPEVPDGIEVDVLRQCACFSRRPDSVCTSCGRAGAIVWVVYVERLGGDACACECALMRIDPDPRQAWRFHVERKRDEMEDPELDELLDELEQESLK